MYSKAIRSFIFLSTFCFFYSTAICQSTRPVQSIRGHLKKINALAVSADNALLASASDDNSVQLWEVTALGLSQRDNGKLEAHTRAVNAIQFSSSNKWLLSASDDGSVNIWDVEDGIVIMDFNTGSQGTTEAPVNTAIFLPGDKSVIIGTQAGEIIVLELLPKNDRIKVVKIFYHSPKNNADNPIAVLCLRSLENGSLLLSSGEDNKLRLWKTMDWKTVDVTECRDFISTLEVFPGDPTKILTAFDNSIISIWQAKKIDKQKSLSKLFSYNEHQAAITHSIFNIDGKSIISGSIDGTMILYNIEKKEVENKITFEELDYPSAFVACNLNKYVIAGTGEGWLRVWTANSLNAVTPFHPNREGMDVALLIAINDYKSDQYRDLRSPIKEIDSIKVVLEKYYGFIVDTLKNPTLEDIESAVLKYKNLYGSNVLNRKGQLLIFLSGHGQVIDKQGFFLPQDANPNNPYTSFLAYDTYRKAIDEIKCDHIAVIIDACYSGSFDPENLKSGGPDGFINPPGAPYQYYFNRKCRQYLTSGALEGTPDDSKLVWYLLDGLIKKSQSKEFFKLGDLYYNYIGDHAIPKPLFGNFGNNKDPGGEFIFLPVKSAY